MSTNRLFRVVLADDHAAIRRGIRKLLEKNSDICVVAESATGAEAIQLVQRLRPDLLLLDIELPDMKGYDVSRELRARHNHVLILVLSACCDNHFITEVFQSGINGYLNKSEGPANIRDAIALLVENRKNAGQHPIRLAKN